MNVSLRGKATTGAMGSGVADQVEVCLEAGEGAAVTDHLPPYFATW